MEFTNHDIEETVLVLKGVFVPPEALEYKVQQYVSKLKEIEASTDKNKEQDYLYFSNQSLMFFESKEPSWMIYYLRTLAIEKLHFKENKKFLEVALNYQELVIQAKNSY